MKYFYKQAVDLRTALQVGGLAALTGGLGMTIWNKIDENKVRDASERLENEAINSKDKLTDEEAVELIKNELGDRTPGYYYDPLMSQIDAGANSDDESPLIMWGDDGGKGIDRRILLHEIGHAKDWNNKDSKLKYFYDNPFKGNQISAEIEAWDLADVEPGDPMREAALDTYRHSPRGLRYNSEGLLWTLGLGALLGSRFV